MQEIRVQPLGREDSPGEGNGSPLQCSLLGNRMDGGAWQATVHGVAMNQTWLSNNSGLPLALGWILHKVILKKHRLFL